MKKFKAKLFLSLLLLNIYLLNVIIEPNTISRFDKTFEKDNQIILNPKIADLLANVYINASNIIRELPSNIYGSNINFINNGSQILEPSTLELYRGVTDRFSELVLSTIRFPGGSLSENYSWWEGIGPKALRPMGVNAYNGQPTTNNYGIDEHFDFCNAIGAIPTITVNFGSGNELEAANWVEYCNVEIPTSGTSGWTVNDFKGNEFAPSGYFAWLRGQYGHNEPYNVTNWEVGNEVYNYWTNDYNATQYATRFNSFYTAMKAIDPTIKVAAIGYEEPDGIWGTDTAPWNREVAKIAGANMDALHIHSYGPVGDDGKTIFFWGNGEVTQTVKIPQAGDYDIWITAEGMNGITGPYPSSPNNYANFSININSVSQVNFSVLIDNPRLYNHTINFPDSGNYNLGIEFYNEGPGRGIMMLGDVILENETKKILVEYRNQSIQYNAVMATPNYRGNSVFNISKILEDETGRNDIEIWITEFNTLYNTIGFGIDQPLKFQSAVAMADMAVQFVKNGADIIQQWSSINDFYVSLMHEAKILGDSSQFHTLDLLIEGLGQYLVNSTVICPTFDLGSTVGWIPPQFNIPYLDVLPNLNENYLSLIMINKHPTEALNVNLDVEGFESTNTASLTIVNATSIGAIDYNLPSQYYNYTIGRIGQAININNSHILQYPSYDNAFPQEGTIEFWIKPRWDGDDGKDYPLMSIGQSFQLLQYHTGGIVAVLTDDNWTTNKVIYGSSTTWNAGEWHHIALTWDYGKSFSLYLDGIHQMTESLNGFNFYFEHRQPMLIGQSLFDRENIANVSLDEFRMMSIARTSAQITQDYNDGVAGTPLNVDGNTTVLFHFDNTIEDSELDHQTIITTKKISYPSSGGIIMLPKCSVSLLILQKSNKQAPPDDDDDGDGRGDDKGSFDIGEFITSPNGYATIGILFGSIIGLIVIISKKKSNRAYKY